jgi:hypothetical protein
LEATLARDEGSDGNLNGITGDMYADQTRLPHGVALLDLYYASVLPDAMHDQLTGELAVAEKLGELFASGRPETDKGKVVSFPSLSQKEEGPAGSIQQALRFQSSIGCGGQI